MSFAFVYSWPEYKLQFINNVGVSFIQQKGKLQTGDRILFVNGIDVKTISLKCFKELYHAGATLSDKTMRLRVQHDKGCLISERFSL